MFFYEICLLHLNTELHIRRGIEDNSEIINIFLNKNILCDPSLELSHQYVVTPHQNRLKTVLMMSHKICFCREIWLIIPKLSLLPHFIWSTVNMRMSQYMVFH